MPDPLRHKFTGSYERDDETGLDYAKARYYANIQGRFTSIDPFAAINAQPQSWNRYTYCLNNPLKFVDPSGLIWGYKDHNGVRTFQWFDGNTVDDGWTAYIGSNYFIGVDQAVWLGDKGNWRYVSRAEAEAGQLDEYLRGPDSPLGSEEKAQLQRDFAYRMIYGEHPEILDRTAMASGLFGGLLEGFASRSIRSLKYKFNIFGEREAKGFVDVSAEGMFAKGRPLTSEFAAGSASDIFIRNSPIIGPSNPNTLSEIVRLSGPGTRITLFQPADAFQGAALKSAFGDRAVVTLEKTFTSKSSGLDMTILKLTVK